MYQDKKRQQLFTFAAPHYFEALPRSATKLTGSSLYDSILYYSSIPFVNLVPQKA